MAQSQPNWRDEQIRDFPSQTTSVAVMPQARDQVRWGPIWAGVVVTLASMIILGVLGVAVGLAAVEADTGALTTGSLVWGAATALLSFFLGGLTAGRTAAVNSTSMGAFNGAMVWALAMVTSLLVITLGAGAILGLMGMNGVFATPDLSQQAPNAVAAVDNGVWWTLGAMALGLGVAALGGYVGARMEENVVIRETTTRVTPTRP